MQNTSTGCAPRPLTILVQRYDVLARSRSKTPTPIEWRGYLKHPVSLVPRAVGQKLLLLCIIALSTGCALAPAYRAHPSFSQRFSQVKNITIPPVKVDVFYLETGGLPEKREEWSTQARKNILAALQAELQAKIGNRIQLTPGDYAAAEESENLTSTYAMFEVVGQAVILHTYAPNPDYLFKEKIDNFDYSLGGDVKDLASDEADALLLVTGRDHVWSEGRKALQALGVVLGIGAGVATGVAVIPRLGGGTVLQAALVDARNGDLLWYNTTGSGAGIDLRDSNSAAELVKDLFKDFPPAPESE